MVGMLPDSFVIHAIFLLLDSVAGLAIGAACGWLVSLASKGHQSKLRQDSFFGLLGFLGGIIGTVYICHGIRTPLQNDWMAEAR